MRKPPPLLVRYRRRLSRALALTLAGLFTCGPLVAAPQVRVETQERLTIHPRVMGTGAVDTEEPIHFDVDPDRGGETTFPVRWPDDDRRITILLRAVEKPSLQHDHVLDLETEVLLEGGRTVRAAKTLGFSAPTTTLFEIHRENDTPLVLAIRIEGRDETRFHTASSYSEPIKLRLQIQRVLDGNVVTLENDLLQTFAGESVVYEFRLGRAAESDAARIELLPLRIVGDIVELEMDISGRLPINGELAVVGTRKKMLASRGSASTLSFESGDPPSGYRFVVVPDF